MNRRVLSYVAVACAFVLGVVAGGCQKLRARDQLNKGVLAYKNAQYTSAVEHFKTAVSLEPTYPTARLYLAMAYMSQYIPGAESPENAMMAQAAHENFMKVLEVDPRNSVALAYIALLYFNQKKFEDARDWYLKLIAVDPANKEAHYTLGVISWTKSFQKRMEARAKLGMKPEDPGPLKDKKVRETVKAENLPIIEEGITHLEKALEIDKEYDDAMAYLNLLLRERADLADSKEAYEKDVQAADDWTQRTLDTKKLKASRMPQGVISSEPSQ